MLFKKIMYCKCHKDWLSTRKISQIKNIHNFSILSSEIWCFLEICKNQILESGNPVLDVG